MAGSKSNIPIVILAAGASNRMGEPKQLLKWGDSTLINHAVHVARKADAKDVIVVLGANFELIHKTMETSKVIVLNNYHWKMGLGKSIAVAVEYLQKSKQHIDGVLISLCDQPFISSDFLKSMVSKFQPNKNQIVATSYKNAKVGVPVLFDKAYFNELLLLNDDQGAKRILEVHQPNVQILKPPTENMDLDTKEDYINLYQSNFKN
ncbi:nucleotidyltransferase family protein [Confluentibacter sediminis]|uniref:nucleotidyltransferase family protein n=1 Tax=Confluentibacter sediminis TaxID=2219045 RepID=UPI000DAF0E28|nr:nucleotidyltransferase family protein [Confluentibacter sediminis]